jgi:hypothetical protein
MSDDCRFTVRNAGNSDLIVAALWIGGTEATGHEAEAKFQKKTQFAPNPSCVCQIWNTPRPQC